MNSQLRVAVFNAGPDALAEMQRRLDGCECEPASFDADSQAIAASFREPPDILLVYGCDDPHDAVDLCHHIRSAQQLRNVPLLLVITRYQIYIAHELRKMERSHFIMTPVEEADLRRQYETLSGFAS